jgi:hypothetical protein
MEGLMEACSLDDARVNQKTPTNATVKSIVPGAWVRSACLRARWTVISKGVDARNAHEIDAVCALALGRRVHALLHAKPAARASCVLRTGCGLPDRHTAHSLAASRSLRPGHDRLAPLRHPTTADAE